jgi:tRNA uridine 5-carbamoylmethylation protein Kti12
MKPRLVILRGRPTSGKSTAWHTLKKKRAMKNWNFIDNASLKNKLGKEPGKVALMEQLKIATRNKENILIEEMSEKTLKKYIRYYIKRYNYQIITFQFFVSTKTAYKRDIQRAKEKWHPKMGKKWIVEMHELHDKRVDSKGILIDTDKLNKKQVVDIIIKKLK